MFMTLTGKDLVATILTALAVLAFAATRESWNVWLVGSSHRWAAGAMMLLGGLTCTLGSAAKDAAATLLAVVGIVALGAAVWAIWTGSMTALWVLAVAIGILWVGATMRHAWHPSHRPIPI